MLATCPFVPSIHLLVTAIAKLVNTVFFLNESISTKIGTSGLRRECMKWSSFGVRRSKVKVRFGGLA